MKISEMILDRIKNNYSLDAFVKSAVAKINNHISANNMVFFPEYTDHDITHFEAVLETAIDLATAKSIELMSDVDFGVLTVSVMLHDLGMHLTKDGFRTLISIDGPMRPIDGFGDLPWDELWVSFLADARRFDDRKLEELFGPNFQPITDFPGFDEPWGEFDYLLVGEFLRQHHPRLGHEIALYGMPSVDGTVTEFCGTGSSDESIWSDLSGLVARSHGMALRQTFSYLDQNYSSRIETRSCHPVFLMTTLRIADYLQIQSERAPTSRTQVTKFNSPISSREWSVHQCVTDITNLNDPEAIDVTANPEDVQTYLRLKYWLTDLQRELDISWAVLGEVFGLQSHSGLSALGLRIRRIKSNLDPAEVFANKVQYIPESISFEGAGSDLLKLLVGPLYGNEISVGLRELVQNATDAVKELDQLVEQGVIEKPQSWDGLLGDVQVDFVTTKSSRESRKPKVEKVIFTDRGVGMSTSILKNYFLRAGASFRNSDAWKEKFENDDGSLKIQRSGRFGVGALAAFLLGDTITVETRHYSEPEENGLSFSAGIETKSINVVRKKTPVGTRITVQVPERLASQIGRLLPEGYSPKVNAGWNTLADYFGQYPKLAYCHDYDEIPWDESCFLPTSTDRLQGPWNYFETPKFEVNWTFKSGIPELSVNQIRVSGLREGRYGHSSLGLEIQTPLFDTPRLSVGDKSGTFPLNLQRNSVASKTVPFSADLAREITDEFVFTCAFHRANFPLEEFPKYAGLSSGSSYRKINHRWFHCSDGKVLNHDLFLEAYAPEYAIVRYGGVEGRLTSHELLDRLSIKKAIYCEEPNDEFYGRKHTMKGKLTRLLGGEVPSLIQQSSQYQNVYVPQVFTDLIRSNMKPGKEALKVLDALNNDKVTGWLSQTSYDLVEPQEILNWRRAFGESEATKSVISFHKLDASKLNPQKNNDQIVFDRWMELVGAPFIPNAKCEIDRVYSDLRAKLGSKFDAFELRAMAQVKKRNKKQKNTDS
ncbi:ATP-binding protein [Loktanella sp. F6476L]|uniref:HD domain-containing protein n=1 Tax=Loktanella sp. F6476L TaxID=2926405 RepID=UPI001FF303DB|nr:ATP-binding protein [Loktanella sp. F6476L]MCK0122293.1 ATP-binding protein [Loktanella sp. F6476L]